MVTRRQIKNYVGRVVEQFHPRQVILFGSYASGKPTADSDVDLLVVMPHKEHPAVKAAEIRQRIHAGFALDLIVRNPQTIRRRLAMGDYFIEDILGQGQVLYEADNARVG
jgi:uncharacterized protein